MAVRTISVAGGNRNAVGTWDEGIVPTAADDVVCRGGEDSGNVAITTGSVCKSAVFTNYVGTISSNGSWAVSGNFTLVAGMTFTYSGVLTFNTTATLTSAGKTFAGGVTFAGTSQTYTLADDWDINGTITFSGTTATTMTGQTIYAGGSLTVTGIQTVSGTTAIVMNGTGILTCSSTNRIMALNFTFNTAGEITGAGGSPFSYKTGTLTYTAGTMTTMPMYIVGTCTLNTSGMTFSIVFNIISSTTTLSSDLNISGTLTTGNTTTAQVFNGAFNINVGGNLTHNGTTGSITGTATIVLNGTGNWSMPIVTTGTWNINTTINTTGTLTLTSDIGFGNSSKTLTYTAGTIVFSTYYFKVGNMTIDYNGGTIDNLTITQASAAALVLASDLIVSTNLKNGDSASHMTISSDVGGTQRKLTLSQGAAQDFCKVDPTDIDSSDGQTILTHRGVLSNATNWLSYTRARDTVASIFG